PAWPVCVFSWSITPPEKDVQRLERSCRVAPTRSTHPVVPTATPRYNVVPGANSQHGGRAWGGGTVASREVARGYWLHPQATALSQDYARRTAPDRTPHRMPKVSYGPMVRRFRQYHPPDAARRRHGV